MRACVRPRPSGLVQTYPEGGSHALQVCQHHHQVVRVGHFVGLAETQGTWCSRLLRPIRLKPSQYNSAQCALLYTVKVAGRGPSVHACAVFLRAESRDGDKFNQTPKPWTLHSHGDPLSGLVGPRLAPRPRPQPPARASTLSCLVQACCLPADVAFCNLILLPTHRAAWCRKGGHIKWSGSQ